MPKRTAREAERTREALISAARVLFTEKGYDSVSTIELSERASVTRGALYHHFGGKETLFREVAIRVLKEQGQRILEHADKGDGPWDALIKGCEAFIEYSQRDEYLRIVLIDAPVVLGIEDWKSIDDTYTTSTLREGFEELSALEHIDVPDAEVLAEALSGAMNQVSLWAATQPAARSGPGNISPTDRAKATIAKLLSVLAQTT